MYNPGSASLLWFVVPLRVLLCHCEELAVVVSEGLKVELVILVESLHLCLAQGGEVFPSEFLCGSFMTGDSTCFAF